MKTDFDRYTGEVHCLRMRDMKLDNGQEVSLKGVGEGTTLELRSSISFLHE